jgi:hypothetical protein
VCTQYLECYQSKRRGNEEAARVCNEDEKESARYAVVEANPVAEEESEENASSRLGENKSTVCGSLDNSGSAIGKALMDAAGTAAEAYIQTQSVRTQ